MHINIYISYLYVHMYGCVCKCVCRGLKLKWGVFFNSFLNYLLLHGLSMEHRACPYSYSSWPESLSSLLTLGLQAGLLLCPIWHLNWFWGTEL